MSSIPIIPKKNWQTLESSWHCTILPRHYFGIYLEYILYLCSIILSDEEIFSFCPLLQFLYSQRSQHFTVVRSTKKMSRNCSYSDMHNKTTASSIEWRHFQMTLLIYFTASVAVFFSYSKIQWRIKQVCKRKE